MKQLLIAVLVAATTFTACKKETKDDSGSGNATKTTAQKLEGSWKLVKVNDSIPPELEYIKMVVKFKEDATKKGTGTLTTITSLTMPGFPSESDTSYSTYEVINNTQIKAKDEDDGEESTVTIEELTSTKLVISGIKDDNDQDQKMEFEKEN
ncbi:MAG: lipocalin family protein [Bacteroidetes bacterium]|nr:lipocalin family protein [Bacteroidota bacterium]